jgi:phage terminase large subunit GpA-like protein
MTEENDNILQKAFRRGLTPDPTLTYAQWAKKYFILPPSSAAQGLINLNFTPYLIEPLETLSWTSPILQEYFMKGIQIAASTLFDILICGVIDYFQCPVIMYHGSDSMAIEYVKIRLEPCFENNPRLRGKVFDGYDKKSKSTHGLKIGQGFNLKFCGGIAEKAYRSYSAAIVLMDDIDAFPRDIGGTEKRKGQGSPIDLAITRTNARQGKYKVAVSGSPTDAETSLIYEKFRQGDQRYYHVPCPFCNHLQIIDFKRIRFKKDANDVLINAPELECFSCNKLISENYKYDMMQINNGAKWIATKENKEKKIISRHLSSAYSLLGYTWTEMVKEFIVANREMKRGNVRPLITFKNTKLGIPSENDMKKKIINHTKLYENREDWEKVPEDGIIITAGVDIQAQRIEVLVVAFGEKSNVYCLEYKVIGGNTMIEYGLDGSPYNILEEYLQKTFLNSWGHNQPILHTCIDLGYRSIIASPFLQKMSEKNHEITGIFGSSSKNKKKTFVGEPIKNKYDVQQREINVNEGKTLNYHKLRSGLIHFNKHPSFTDYFFRQLTVEWWSEKEQRWICPEHTRNEATDMLNYATAAFSIYTNDGNVDWKDFRNWNRNGCKITGSAEISVISEGVKI